MIERFSDRAIDRQTSANPRVVKSLIHSMARSPISSPVRESNPVLLVQSQTPSTVGPTGGPCLPAPRAPCALHSVFARAFAHRPRFRPRCSAADETTEDSRGQVRLRELPLAIRIEASHRGPSFPTPCPLRPISCFSGVPGGNRTRAVRLKAWGPATSRRELRSLRDE